MLKERLLPQERPVPREAAFIEDDQSSQEIFQGGAGDHIRCRSGTFFPVDKGVLCDRIVACDHPGFEADHRAFPDTVSSKAQVGRLLLSQRAIVVVRNRPLILVVPGKARWLPDEDMQPADEPAAVTQREMAYRGHIAS